jgi:GT2 family glycosyltransferase
VSISIVIATTGNADLIQHCVQALGNGARQPDHVIVAGDTRAVSRRGIVSRGESFPVTLVGTEAVGPSRARNLGASVAETDWLAFTDDDCVPASGWVAAVADATAGVDGVTGRVLPLPTDDPSRVAVSSRLDTAERTFGGQDDALAPWRAGTGGNLAVSRDVFRELEGFDERFGPGAKFRAAEDLEFLRRLLQHGVVRYVPDAVVYHETKTPAQRLARRFPYGYGVGALSVSAGSDGAVLARRYLAMQARSLLAQARAGSPRGAVEPVLAIAGVATGAAAAGMLRLRNGDVSR